ncbi:chitin deacetylase [Entophlyctis sp. JEL0112]|nr:chitin deacetylase [Entophlyctis sp. JEL0112]
MATPDTYASYRVPAPPAVPKWTAFIESLTDNTTYPWIGVAPLTSSNDGGATGGSANGAGAAWGTLANTATEVFACPTGQFDDGPILTDQSMALLKENNVVATFFLIGSNVVNNATHSQFVKDIYNAGHQIALHTWTHRQISLQTSDVVISELFFNILSIYNLIGKVPRYFRPPYSAIDDRVRYILHAMGLRPVIWNIESLDADITDPPTLAPGGIDVSGENVTVANSIQHTEHSFNQSYDPRWNYFPSSTEIGSTGRYEYTGFISLEHDITAADIQVAQAIVPFMAKSGFKSVYVNACDQILPNASFYLDDNSALVQFIKSINLPLTDADYEAYTGYFTPNAAGGASVNGVLSTAGSTGATTTTKSSSTRTVASVIVLVFCSVMMI